MKWFLEQWRELPGIETLLKMLSHQETVQGVLVGYDPFWLRVWHVQSILGGELSRYLLRHSTEYARDGVMPSWDYWDFRPFNVPGDIELPPPDHDELQQLYRWAKDRFPLFEKPPVQIVVVTERHTELELPRGLGEGVYSIVQSVRGRAWLAMPKNLHSPVPGGVSLGCGTVRDGTLGGMLGDAGRNAVPTTYHAVTCAHVVQKFSDVDQPAQKDNAGKARHMGKVMHVSSLTPSPVNAICNPFHPAAKLHTVDAALVELDPAVPAVPHLLGLRPPTGIAAKSQVNPGDLLDMAGKESGRRRLVVGKVAITFRYHDVHAGGHYCFEEAFEVNWPTLAAVAGGPPVQAGDSGAWLLNATGEWVGMIVASDANHGYAIYAENVEAWVRRQLGAANPLSVL